jgi:predicted nucleic acid-binding protein
MATQPLQSDGFRLKQVFRSDSLPTLRKFLEMSPDLKSLVDHRVLQIRAIVDTNRIFADLLWKLSKREDPRNRSGLDEDLDAGVLVLIAPDYLKVEMEKHLPILAEQTGASLAEAEHEWASLRAKLHFYRPVSPLPEGWSDDPKDLPPNREIVDPKDLPYLHASQELGLPVFTSDRHLQKMGAPVLWVCIDTTCRDYIRTDTAACGHARFDTACRDHARSMSVTIGFTLGSTFTVTIGVETLRAAVRGIKSLFDGFLRQPAWLQLAVTGALAAIVIHPKSRAKLVRAWESAWAAACQDKGPMFEGFLLLMQQVATAQSDAAKTHQQIQAALPPAKKAIAIVHARRVCVVSAGPVSIEEIMRRMRNEGYVSRAKDPEVYLRRALRKSGQFIEVSPRMFELRA